MTYGPIEAISTSHITGEFDCGSDAQTTWLRTHALQAHRTDTSRVRVVTRAGDPRVVGYYALAAGSVELADAPSRIAKGMPRYPVPVIILTRFGVDRSEQGRGLGRALIKDVILRVASASEVLGARALLIHCEDEDARTFYLHLAEFEPASSDPLHLYLLMSDLRRTIGPDDLEPDKPGWRRSSGSRGRPELVGLPGPMIRCRINPSSFERGAG